MLENAACPFTMYGHSASPISTKKRDLAIFWWDRQYFCFIVLVGMKLRGRHCRKSRNCAARRIPGLAHGFPTPSFVSSLEIMRWEKNARKIC